MSKGLNCAKQGTLLKTFPIPVCLGCLDFIATQRNVRTASTIRVEEIALRLEAIASVVEAIALRLERWPFGCVFPNLFEFRTQKACRPFSLSMATEVCL